MIKRLFAPIYRHLLRAPVWLAVWAWVSVAAFNTACADPVYQLTQKYFPQTDRVGVFEGEPLAASVYAGEQLLGYVFRTTDIAPIPAYSGKPITLLVGIGLDGRISGLEITQHSEPILAAGVSEKDLKHYVDQYQGVSVRERVKLGGAQREGYVTIDGITGATITAMVMNATVMKAIKKVAESRGIPSTGAGSGAAAQSVMPAEVQADRQATPAWLLGETSEPFWVSVWRGTLV